MKFKILIGGFILISNLCYSQSQLNVRFIIPDTGRVFLYNTQTSKTDTVAITDGNVVFSSRLERPTLFYMFIDGYNDNRPMNIVLSDKTTVIRFDSLNTVKEVNKVADAYPNQPHFINDPNNNKTFYDFLDTWIIFTDSIMSMSNTKELLEQRKNLYQSFLITCDKLIQENNDKYIAAIIINFLLNNKLLQIETIQTYYNYLSKDVKDSFFGIKIGEYAGKAGRLTPGNPAPAFELADMNGKVYNLPKLYGKKVLLHFWSSSCAPCIKEAPDLIRLTETYKKTLTTVNISLDTDKEKWLKGIERAGIGKLNNVCDLDGLRGKVAKAYAINVIPTYYLIDEYGKIILKGTLNHITNELHRNSN